MFNALALVAALSALAVCNAVSFVGAVVEFSPSFPNFGKAYTRAEAVASMMLNVNRLDKYAAQAKAQGAQIIVFPEYGIQADEPYSNWTRAPGAGSIVPFTEPIPGAFHCSKITTLVPAAWRHSRVSTPSVV